MTDPVSTLAEGNISKCENFDLFRLVCKMRSDDFFYYPGEALLFHATLLLGSNELDFAVISRCLPRNRFADGVSFLLPLFPRFSLFPPADE